MGNLLDAVKLQLQKDGKPLSAADSPACVALCKVLEHQLYMRDMADGDLQQQIESLKKKNEDSKTPQQS